MSSSNELEQFYDQAMDGLPMVVTTSVTNSTMLSPNSSCATNGQLTPKGNVSKPIRRRSRASKRTPTTLLNANTNNFRALVQQFTGCPNTSISFRNQKGPVNLDFGKGRDQENQRIVTSVMAPFGSNYYYHQQSDQSSQQIVEHQRHQFQQQQLLQQQQLQQQSMYSFGNDVFVGTSSNPRSNMESVHGFALEADVTLHELTMNSFSSDPHDRNDGYFF